MADNRKYYYLKLKDNFFDSDSMVLLESMQDGYLFGNILLKLYLKSLKDDGRLTLNGRIPYNEQMIANVTRHQIGTVERALKIFKELGLIEVLDSGVIYMLDIQNYIGKSSTEADRQRDYYNRIKNESCKNSNKISCKSSNKISVPEIELEKEIDIEIEKEKELKIDYQLIVDIYNNTCVSFPKVTKLSEKRRKAIRARFNTGYTLDDFKTLFNKAEQSSFLKGKNNHNWSATFDWLIKDANMAKVLDGNYDDRNPRNPSDTGNDILLNMIERGDFNE